MRNLLIMLAAFGFLAACKSGKKTNSESSALTASVINKILGSFVGAFGENKITLLISQAGNGTVEGRSIVGGNDRPFSGTLSENDGYYSVEAKEPGDDPNDGIFKFTIDPNNPDVVVGSWAPNDPTKQVKQYRLDRRKFVYRTDVGEYPEASQRLLKPGDVEDMMKSDLEQMRNEIFARHGYCFKRKSFRDLFEFKDWYVPDNTDIRDKLTDIEKTNIALIKRYEKYADDYGDDFGR